MTIITMSRQVGTRDKEIADRVAEELGLKHIGPPDDAVFMQPVTDRQALEEALYAGASFRERMRMEATGMRYRVIGEIIEAAEKGNILVRGMGATAYLRRVHYVLSVSIWASMEYRVDTQVERWQTLERAEAERLVLDFDEQRQRFVKDVFGLDAADIVSEYDLGLNKAKLGVADCVEAIVLLARREVFTPSEAGRKVLADLKLENAVRAAICELPEMHDLRAKVSVEIDSEKGSAVLSGVVGTHRVATKIEERAAGIEGIESVENRIVAKPLLV